MSQSKFGCLASLCVAIAFGIYALWPEISGLHVDRDSPDPVADVVLLRATLGDQHGVVPCTATKTHGVIRRPDDEVGQYFYISEDGLSVQCHSGIYSKAEDDTWTFAAKEPIADAEKPDQKQQLWPPRDQNPLLQRYADEFESKASSKTQTRFLRSTPNSYPRGIHTANVQKINARFAHLELLNSERQLLAAFPYPPRDDPDFYFHPTLPVMFLCTKEFLAIWDLATFKELAHISAKGSKEFPILTSFSPASSIVAVAQGNEIHFWHVARAR